MQCRGTTKKGLRCRIQGPDEYCRYHKPQPTKWPRAPAPPDRDGYIYMYTLCSDKDAMVFDNKAQKYKKLQQGFFSRLFAPKQMLVKVGFTTRTPHERMAQWEAQCKHKLKPVIPKRSRHAPHYDYQKNGWHSGSAYKVEQNILAQLRYKFGAGRIECGACKSGDNLGRHVEWFLLPFNQVKSICKVVEATII